MKDFFCSHSADKEIDISKLKQICEALGMTERECMFLEIVYCLQNTLLIVS